MSSTIIRGTRSTTNPTWRCPTRSAIGRRVTAGQLHRVGLAQAYPESALESEDLAAFRLVVDWMLESHEPFPAYAVDGHWNIVRANAAADRFLATTSERNVVRLTYAGAWRDLIDNWDDIAWVGLRRLQAEAWRLPQDNELAELVELAASRCQRPASPTRGRIDPGAVPDLSDRGRPGAHHLSGRAVQRTPGRHPGRATDRTRLPRR